jgi:hypothetical protein
MPRFSKTQLTRTSIHSTWIAAATIGVLAGCGGNGGGGTPSTLNSSPGVLAPNVIFYSSSPDNGNTMVLNQVNPDGSGKTTLATLPVGFQGIAMNPAVRGQTVFGYSPSGRSPMTYGIYKNSSISSTGAVMLVPPTYSFIESIQVSADGAWVYFVAPIGTGNPALYKVPSTGGTPKVLDNSGFILSANVDPVTGSNVIYDKEIVYPNGNQKTAIFELPTSGSVSPNLITNDPNDNYEFPQFSKDGTQIVMESDINDPNFEIYTMSSTGGSINGAGLTQVTNLPAVAKENGVSFSADGTSTAFVGNSASATATGIYVSGTIGANPPAPTSMIVQDNTVQAGLYWTSNGGRSASGTMAYLARPRHHGLIP